MTFRVCVVANGASRLQGGMFHSVRRLWQETNRIGGATISVKTIADPFVAEDSHAFAPIPVEAFPAIGPRQINYSPALARALNSEQNACDIISNHGMWVYASYAAYRASHTRKTPFIIHPEGMLEPWALQFSRTKKRLASWLFQDAALREARCVRAISRGEADNFVRYGVRAPIALIPNGIDADEFINLPPRTAIESFIPASRDRKRLLFLSRVHPKKGLVPLVRAWASLDAGARRDWLLIIAGQQELDHESEIRQLANELGVTDSIAFAGPLYGEQRRAAFGGADAFVLPSFSETLGLAVMEAAASGLPVILTPGCNFPEMAAAGGAIEVAPEPRALAGALETMLRMSDSERAAMGALGRELVRRDFTWPEAGRRMHAVCEWILGGGPSPSCLTLPPR